MLSLYNEILTDQNLKHIHDKFRKNYFDGKVNLVITGLNDEELTMSETYKRGYKIDQLLRQHYEENNISEEVYGLYFDGCDNDDENCDNETQFSKITYIGRTDPKTTDKRTRPCGHVSKLLHILEDIEGWHPNKTQNLLYQHISERIVENDKFVHPRMNMNIPYDVQIIEGVVFEANIVSNRQLVPNLCNDRLETVHLRKELQYIFKNGQSDYIALAVFHLKNLQRNYVMKISESMFCYSV